jgi:hypothetical protein
MYPFNISTQSKQTLLFLGWIVSLWTLVQVVLNQTAAIPPHWMQPDTKATILLATCFIAYSFPLNFHSLMPNNSQAALKEAVLLISSVTVLLLVYFIACRIQNISPKQNLSVHINDVFANKLLWAQNILLAPVYEELFFRGRALSKMRLVFFPNLSKENTANSPLNVLFTLQGAWKLVYFNALLFWFFHIPWVSLVNGNLSASAGSFLLGLLCASLIVSGRSLAFVICCHAIANGSGFMWFQIFEASKVGFLMQYFFQTP